VRKGVRRDVHVGTADGVRVETITVNHLLLDAANVTPDMLERLERHPLVDIVEPNYVAKIESTLQSFPEIPRGPRLQHLVGPLGDSMAWGIRSVRADSIWAMYGEPQSGIGIGMLDTGADITAWCCAGDQHHPDLDDLGDWRLNKVDLWWTYDPQTYEWWSIPSNRCPGGYALWDAPVCFYEDDYHGTGVLGLSRFRPFRTNWGFLRVTRLPLIRRPAEAALG